MSPSAPALAMRAVEPAGSCEVGRNDRDSIVRSRSKSCAAQRTNPVDAALVAVQTLDSDAADFLSGRLEFLSLAGWSNHSGGTSVNSTQRIIGRSRDPVRQCLRLPAKLAPHPEFLS